MSLINPIPDTNWLKNNKDNLRISDEAYLELVQIYDLIDSIDWEYSRINDDATLIDKINQFATNRKKTTVSVVYIVKNEENFILKSLASIIDFADEIIIVDTGSTDGTLECITELSREKIFLYTFEWCDDFSKARNYANSHASCDWILVLDADEVVDDFKNLKLLLSYFKLFDSLSDTVFNFNIIRGSDYYKTGKLISNTGAFQYRGRVHESFYSINNKDIYYANLKINVYGQKRENKEKASYYNELLLKTMLDYPTDSRWCYYYFRDNYSQINLNQMFEYSCKSIFKKGNIVSENNFISNYFSVHIIMFILSKMIDENNYILFDCYLNLIEKKVSGHSDFIFLKYAREFRLIQEDILNSMKSFLEEYNKCLFSENIFSPNCINSL
ncbi:TPA: glycosyltransferase family 2 protein, partial [Streptococcus suis]